MNAMNVTAAKPKKGGAVFCAPLGTTLPKSVTEDLNEAFKGLGYVSDNGITNSNSPQADSVKAWGGDVVMNFQTEKKDEYKFKLIEGLNVEVLKAVYGKDNVTGTDIASGITVKSNSAEAEHSAWVFDMIQNGCAKRIVLPNASITNIEDIAYKDNEPVGYGLTVSAIPDNDGNTHYEYIGKEGATV